MFNWSHLAMKDVARVLVLPFMSQELAMQWTSHAFFSKPSLALSGKV